MANNYTSALASGGGGVSGIDLTVECDALFAGSTITATNGTNTYTQTCPSEAPYIVVFNDINPLGTYTISGTVGSETFSVTYDTNGHTMLHVIPNGSTVLPVNDIQTWLHCADIWDKDYTTLNGVLDDIVTFLALINDHNAVDYMVRSTDWCGNGIELVPTMTAFKMPTGEVFESGHQSSGMEGWHSFDGKSTTSWRALDGTSPAWVGYKNTYKVVIDSAKVISTSNARNSQTIRLQGSNDGNTWVDLSSDFIIAQSSEVMITTDNRTEYLYYRIYISDWTTGGAGYNGYFSMVQFYAPEGICSNQIAMFYIGNTDYCAEKLLNNSIWASAISGSEYFESVLNVKVPIMTSNTMPSGEAFCSSYSTASGYQWEAYKAFAGATSTSGSTAWRPSSNNAVNEYVGYDFTIPIKVVRCDILPGARSITSSIIQGSNDKINWTDIQEIEPLSYDALSVSAFNNLSKYRYYRFFIKAVGAPENTSIGYYRITSVQFYGRV